jgi:hypothetical protein
MAYDLALADKIRSVLDVGTDVLGAETELSAWVRRGVDHARSLPPKI